MKADLDALAWPLDRLGEAVEMLAQLAGLSTRSVTVPSPPRGMQGECAGAFIESVAALLGVEAEEVNAPYADIDKLLRSAVPGLLRAPIPSNGFWALAGARGEYLELLAPNGARHSAPRKDLRRAFLGDHERDAQASIEMLLTRAEVPARRRERATSALLQEWLGPTVVRGCWFLREAPHAPVRRRLAEAGVFRHLRWFMLASAADFLLLVLGWTWVGRAALEDRLGGGWLTGWGLIIATAIPLRVIAAGSAVRTAVEAGVVLKQRLLMGALRMDLERLRAEGAGGLFARVLDAEAVESLALSGGLSTSVAALQVFLSFPVLAAGAAGGPLVSLLLAALAATGLAARAEWTKRRRASRAGLDMTHDLVERMVGHRTRLAQEPRARRHEIEDQLLERYLVASRRADEAATATAALIPRGWLLASIGVLGIALASGSPTPEALAIAVGGILLVAQSLRQLTSGLAQIMSSAIAWRGVAPFFLFAGEPEPVPSPAVRDCESAPTPRTLEAHALQFRFPARANSVIRGASFVARPGARLLFEGPSGGGKTVLASLLAGLRSPQGGLLLLGGADPATLGPSGWRRLVTYAPQFHENHLLAGTLAFNLLMGRCWPPKAEDVAEAESICRELGLGPLLDRMPSGVHQSVGEAGWQLSHGERSRVYLARALLQDPEVLILDESFGALDPDTAELALRSVLTRAGTLLVIAHP